MDMRDNFDCIKLFLFGRDLAKKKKRGCAHLSTSPNFHSFIQNHELNLTPAIGMQIDFLCTTKNLHFEGFGLHVLGALEH